MAAGKVDRMRALLDDAREIMLREIEAGERSKQKLAEATADKLRRKYRAKTIDWAAIIKLLIQLAAILLPLFTRSK